LRGSIHEVALAFLIFEIRSFNDAVKRVSTLRRQEQGQQAGAGIIDQLSFDISQLSLGPIVEPFRRITGEWRQNDN
jgi:hypothetical protein